MTAGVKRIWTPAEDAQMLDWRAAGMLLNDIAIRLNSNRTSISERLSALSPVALATASLPPACRPRSALPAPTHPSQPGGRKCLGCGRIFASAHGGNRLCYRCLGDRKSGSCFDPR